MYINNARMASCTGACTELCEQCEGITDGVATRGKGPPLHVRLRLFEGQRVTFGAAAGSRTPCLVLTGFWPTVGEYVQIPSCDTQVEPREWQSSKVTRLNLVRPGGSVMGFAAGTTSNSQRTYMLDGEGIEWKRRQPQGLSQMRPPQERWAPAECVWETTQGTPFGNEAPCQAVCSGVIHAAKFCVSQEHAARRAKLAGQLHHDRVAKFGPAYAGCAEHQAFNPPLLATPTTDTGAQCRTSSYTVAMPLSDVGDYGGGSLLLGILEIFPKTGEDAYAHEIPAEAPSGDVWLIRIEIPNGMFDTGQSFPIREIGLRHARDRHDRPSAPLTSKVRQLSPSGTSAAFIMSPRTATQNSKMTPKSALHWRNHLKATGKISVYPALPKSIIRNAGMEQWALDNLGDPPDADANSYVWAQVRDMYLNTDDINLSLLNMRVGESNERFWQSIVPSSSIQDAELWFQERDYISARCEDGQSVNYMVLICKKSEHLKIGASGPFRESPCYARLFDHAKNPALQPVVLVHYAEREPAHRNGHTKSENRIIEFLSEVNAAHKNARGIFLGSEEPLGNMQTPRIPGVTFTRKEVMKFTHDPTATTIKLARALRGDMELNCMAEATHGQLKIEEVTDRKSFLAIMQDMERDSHLPHVVEL